MKLMFASDIHGSLFYLNCLLKKYEEEKPEKIILLGDLLYHGPRNDLPKQYEPKDVISALNAIKEEILCVRGNCEAEVDQMVLEFPVLAEYMIMYIEGKMLFITHGHNFNKTTMPPLKKGDILIHGHTHIQAMEKIDGGCLYINPGSVSIPKEGNKNSYMIYENSEFIIKDLEGSPIRKCSINF